MKENKRSTSHFDVSCRTINHSGFLPFFPRYLKYYFENIGLKCFILL